jgi:hypothetical protein
MPIEPITQDQFKKCFTPLHGPKGSLWDRIQSQTLETRWYQYPDKNRIGVVIYDGIDGNWSCVTLEDFGLGHSTHEVKVNLPTEADAIRTLMMLFHCETGETARLLDRMNRQVVANTGRTGAEVLLAIPPETD